MMKYLRHHEPQENQWEDIILRMVNQTRPPWKDANTYQSLDVEEKHPDNPMTQMVELEEAH